MKKSHNTRLRVIAKHHSNGKPFVFETTGRVAQTLLALTSAGDDGITALEMSSWALRLAAYILPLRHQYHLDIDTKSEKHEGGSHGRYIMHTPVEILSVIRN